MVLAQAVDACRAWRPAARPAAPVSIQPNSRAQQTASRYMPMLVGEVRCAMVGSGSSCRLSGGRWLSSGPTQCSKKRQVSRASVSQVVAVARRAARAARRAPARPAAPPGRPPAPAPTAGTAAAPATGCGLHSARDGQRAGTATLTGASLRRKARQAVARLRLRLRGGGPFEQVPAADQPCARARAAIASSSSRPARPAG